MRDDNTVDGGNYDVIRARLEKAAGLLHDATQTLDSKRRDNFGGTEIQIAGNTRVRTANNCVPMDIVNVGGHMVFAYNVFVGLRRETHVEDVFTLHAWEDGSSASLALAELPSSEHGGFLEDPQFISAF